MSSLIKSAEAALECNGRATERLSRSRKHLTSLIHIFEENLREKRVEPSQNEIQCERIAREYEQLRDMQHSLVMAVLVGRADGLDDLDARSGAEAAGTHIEAVALDTAVNDAARSPDGPSENGSGETGSGANGSGENGSGENGFGENGSGETGSGANGFGETGSGENGSGENGSGENESGEKESARNGVDNSSDLRTGLRRIIKKTHSPHTTAGEPA